MGAIIDKNRQLSPAIMYGHMAGNYPKLVSFVFPLETVKALRLPIWSYIAHTRQGGMDSLLADLLLCYGHPSDAPAVIRMEQCGFSVNFDGNRNLVFTSN